MKNPEYSIRFCIADLVIALESRFPFLAMDGKSDSARPMEFVYRGSRQSDIVIKVEVPPRLPRLKKSELRFTTVHYLDNEENWRVYERKGKYIYMCPMESLGQVVFMDRDFTKCRAFLRESNPAGKRKTLQNRKRGIPAWKVSHLVYDFLQILVMLRLARRGEGVILHSVGIKDGKNGIVFAGRSGAGKSTSARLWHENTRAIVINDDRIIVRKKGGTFFMHASPWHGEFNDYLACHTRPVRLNRLFIIRHAPRNKAVRLGPAEAFAHLYPALFPIFWDKGLLGNQAAFCEALARSVDSWSLGWKNDARIIQYVRILK